MGGGSEHRALLVPGWLPVAWGRGCLLIRNSDKPVPEGEEGVLEEEREISLDHLRPEGWWDSSSGRMARDPGNYKVTWPKNLIVLLFHIFSRFKE